MLIFVLYKDTFSLDVLSLCLWELSKHNKLFFFLIKSQYFVLANQLICTLSLYIRTLEPLLNFILFWLHKEKKQKTKQKQQLKTTNVDMTSLGHHVTKWFQVLNLICNLQAMKTHHQSGNLTSFNQIKSLKYNLRNCSPSVTQNVHLGQLDKTFISWKFVHQIILSATQANPSDTFCCNHKF